MIILIARCEVDPAALSGLRPWLDRTNRLTWEESDCLSYSIAVESEAGGVITIVERWRSEAALLAYLATSAMRDFHDALQPAIVTLDAQIYDVNGERPLPLPSPAATPWLRLVPNGMSAA